MLKAVQMRTKQKVARQIWPTGVPKLRTCCKPDLPYNRIAEDAVRVTVRWGSNAGRTMQIHTSAVGGGGTVRSDGVL